LVALEAPQVVVLYLMPVVVVLEVGLLFLFGAKAEVETETFSMVAVTVGQPVAVLTAVKMVVPVDWALLIYFKSFLKKLNPNRSISCNRFI
jgi:hypothetical protein